MNPYLVQYSSTIDIECLTDNLFYLNKYHDEFVNKTDDEYILPVVDLDRLRKTADSVTNEKRNRRINI